MSKSKVSKSFAQELKQEKSKETLQTTPLNLKPFCDCKDCTSSDCPNILQRLGITVTDTTCNFGAKPIVTKVCPMCQLKDDNDKDDEKCIKKDEADNKNIEIKTKQRPSKVQIVTPHSSRQNQNMAKAERKKSPAKNRENIIEPSFSNHRPRVKNK